MTVVLARMLPYVAALLMSTGTAGMARAAGVPEPEQLAPDVYTVMGATAQAAPANRGVVGNVGILVGPEGVILIDTGTSARQARQLLADVRKITDKPVVLAINTHQNPAFVFGNGTLRAAGVPILAHKDTDALINERCLRCLKLLNSALGAEEMEGTEVVRPTLTVEQSTSLSAGGRAIDILYYGTTSAPGSIAVVDRQSGIVFAGGLVSLERIPDAKDADIGQWRAALSSLQALGATRIVPGEGPVSQPSRLTELDRYLASLGPAVQAAFEQRVSLGEAAAAAPVPAFRHWAQYDNMHGKNVEQLYLRLEKAGLNAR
jgi:glyoxylase-like metal-dependent hydrolase (beta-lactamase superfamily II)